MNEEQKPFSLAETVIFALFTATSDVADIFGDIAAFIPVVGAPIYALTKVYSVLVGLGIQFVFFIKGIKPKHQLIFGGGNIADIIVHIPFSQTAALLFAITLANNISKIKAAAGVAGVGEKILSIPGGKPTEAQKGGERATEESAREPEPQEGTPEGARGGLTTGRNGRGGAGEATRERGEETQRKGGGIEEKSFGVESLGTVHELEEVGKPMEELPEPEIRGADQNNIVPFRRL